MDKAKLGVAVLLLVAGVAGFYYFGAHATVLRVLYVIGGMLAGALVAWFTTPGQEFFAYARDSWGETGRWFGRRARRHCRQLRPYSVLFS